MTLYHTGFEKIEQPDIHIGRANADFGQGFYLSDNGDFSRRWARSRRGETTWLNTYTLALDGLQVKRFERNAEWFDYIFHNRSGYPDALSEYDVIVGPIANDTIYDTWGISTSGLLSREQSLRLLMIGPVYRQTAIKTERAASRLRFISAQVIEEKEIAAYRDKVLEEQEAYQKEFAEVMSALLNVQDAKGMRP
ncbi:MAG: DUF3990 domain-containing protein [Clostridia bacterium]|nr:DUF3990 domain-containing protein [Clostridia bacterium]